MSRSLAESKSSLRVVQEITATNRNVECRFEKELEKLRREMESSPHSSASMPGSTTNSPPRSPRTLANTVVNSQSSTNIAGQSQAGDNSLKPARGLNDSPLALGPTLGSVLSTDMDDLSLDEGKKER
jgi:hypothetical protein